MDSLADELLAELSSSLSTATSNHCILFSGGLDSSLLAALAPEETRLYTLGLPRSYDILNSIDSSRLLKRTGSIIELSDRDIVRTSTRLIEMFPGIMMAELGYETLFYLGAEMTDEKVIITGQGADELFFGYMKLRQHPETFDDHLKKLMTRTAPRELEICRSLGKELKTPYLSEKVISISGRMRSFFKNDEISNKSLLRLAARKTGMPYTIYGQHKKAAQYGSGIERALTRNYSKLPQ